MECDGGSFQPFDGGNYCQTCKMGRYTENSRSCDKKCPAGQRTKNNTAADGCQKCPKGSYASETGSYDCYACKPGYYADEEGQKRCKPCPENWFMGLRGQLKCAACDTYYDCKSSEGSSSCQGNQEYANHCRTKFRGAPFDLLLSKKKIENYK